jgi:hypothetical protein
VPNMRVLAGGLVDEVFQTHSAGYRRLVESLRAACSLWLAGHRLPDRERARHERERQRGSRSRLRRILCHDRRSTDDGGVEGWLRRDDHGFLVTYLNGVKG